MINKIISLFKKLWRKFFKRNKSDINILKLKVLDIQNGKVSLQEIKEHFSKNIDPKDFFAENIYQLAKVGIDQFDLPKARTREEIVKSALILTAIFYPKDGLSDDEVIKHFNQSYLDIEGLPLERKQLYEKKPLEDLALIEALIERYKNEPESAKLVAKTETGRSNQDYWIEAFYERTLAKKKRIETYLSDELEPIVLRHSKHGYRTYSREEGQQGDTIIEIIEKYPYLDFVINGYKSVFLLDMEKLDWRALNPVRNKIFAHQFTNDYTQKYTSEIRQEIMTDLNIPELLDRINLMVGRLPKIKHRKEIFEELRDLFNTGKYYGFYALAMPQVEGIFVEMCQLVDPHYKPTGSLNKKVKWMRSFSETHEFDFDYFEFYLPEDRNRFSHYGKDNDIEFRCRCLVLDLINVLTTCENISTPIIYLTKIVTGGVDEINHIGDLAKFVYLVKKTKNTGVYGDIRDDVEKFVYDKIQTAYALDKYIDSLQGEFDESVAELSQWIEYGFYRRDLPKMQFATMAPQEVIANADLIKASYDEWRFVFGEKLKYLFDVMGTVHSLPLLFPNLSQPLKEAIARFKATNAIVLRNLNIIESKIQFDELPDDYFITKKQRMSEIEAYFNV